MLELGKLGWGQGRAELGILCLLQVGEEVLLCLAALVVAVLLGVHGELEEFLVILSVVPAVLVHLLLEVVEGVGEQCVGVHVGELAALLLGKLHQLWVDGSGNLAALAEDHTPHGVVHHHEAALALLHGEEVHQGDVLGILAEGGHQWRITHAWPYVLHLVEELDQKVVHRQLLLALLLADVVDGLAHSAQVCHHGAHHTAWQTAAQQE